MDEAISKTHVTIGLHEPLYLVAQRYHWKNGIELLQNHTGPARVISWGAESESPTE